MAPELLPKGAPDWHITVRLSVYPERSNLSVSHYRLIGVVSKGSRPVMPAQEYERPETMWDVCMILYGAIDDILGRVYP